MPEAGTQHTPRSESRHQPDLIPREFLRAIAVWSLIPAYVLAGAFLGWLADRWLHTWPFGIGIGLILALGLAVRDMLRLRDTL
jgi:F0F1-type ATP synthase assembly protein I